VRFHGLKTLADGLWDFGRRTAEEDGSASGLGKLFQPVVIGGVQPIGARIEIHDDERRLLRGQGIERVLEAESAAEALVIIRGEPVRLVLTPWAPPGMAGVPLLRELKRRPTDRPGAGAVPAIVLLDEGLPRQQVVAAVKAGIAGRLPMPAQAAELVRILRALEG